jgi:2-(1,2-epoxy-1,2-dihydrophenyl)acetyl-CoA isomerase
MAELIGLTIDGGLAVLTLARPEAANAMNWALIEAFDAAVSAIAADPAVRAVLLRAEGKNFCVGGDIGAFASEADPSGYIRRLADRLHRGVKGLAELQVPVVTAVQGAAAGAGLGLAAGGDLVLAARSASFTMAYTGIGLSPDGGATWLLPRLVGLRLAQEMTYMNRRLTAEEALAAGLVTRVVDDADLAAEALALARKLAAGPTLAYGACKRLLSAGALAAFADQLDAEACSISECLATEDAAGAVKAFLARQPPSFKGA